MKHTIISALFIFSSFVGHAQEDILVTATRLPKKNIEAPGTLVLTPEDWEGAVTVLDALEKVPGLKVFFSGTTQTSYLTARGFGEGGHSRLRILLNGIPLNPPDLGIPQLDSLSLNQVEKIEYFHGGSSTRYGDGSIAGVINIITKTHASEPTFILNLLGDSNLSYSVNGEISIPIENHLLSLTASRYQEDPSRDRSESMGWGAGARWIWNIGESMKTNLGFSFVPKTYQLPGSLTPVQFAENPNQAVNQVDFTEGSTWRTDARWNGTSEGLSWDTPVSYSSATNNTDFAVFSWFFDTVLRDFSFYPVVGWKWGNESIKGSVEAGAEWNWSNIYLKKYSTAQRVTQNGEADVSRSVYGGFLSTKAEVSGWGVEASARGQGGTFDGGASVKGNQSLGFFTGSSTLSYVSETVSSSLGWTRVFRLPLLDEKISYQGFGDSFLEDLGPEFGHSWDWLTDLRVGKIKAGLNIFALFMEQEILFDNVLSINVNQGLSRRLGFAPQITYEDDWGSVSLNYQWLDARPGWDLNGNKYFIPLVSPHQWGGNLTLKFPEGITLETLYQGFSSAFYNTTNTKSLEARHLLNLNLTWTKNWDALETQVVFNVENIFDDRTPSTALEGFSNDGFYPSPERQFRLSLRLKW